MVLELFTSVGAHCPGDFLIVHHWLLLVLSSVCVCMSICVVINES